MIYEHNCLPTTGSERVKLILVNDTLFRFDVSYRLSCLFLCRMAMEMQLLGKVSMFLYLVAMSPKWFGLSELQFLPL